MTSPNINSQCLLSVFFLLIVRVFCLFNSSLWFVLSLRVKYLKYSNKLYKGCVAFQMISENNIENQ